MERNWLHYFWQSGELPPTLSALCRQLEHTFVRRTNGRQFRLNFKNQVTQLGHNIVI